MFQSVVIFTSGLSVARLNLGRNPIVTIKPAIKIDQPATLTAEGKISGINPALPFAC
jgi:hypothetical protein